MALAPPTCAAIRPVCSSMMLCIVQFWRPPRGREEPAQHLHAVLGVQHLGMELDAVEPPARGLHRRYRRRRRARG